MVGLVTHILSVSVHGEGKAQTCETEEGGSAQGCLTEGDVPVDRLSIKEGCSHFGHTVGGIPAQGELIVGLFVTSGVAAGSADPVLTYEKDVIHSCLL